MNHAGMQMGSSSMASMASMSGMASMTGMASMASSTGSASMDMDMMNMDMQDGMMMMSSMAMTFFTSTTTPLWSMDFMPRTQGQYAGTCIFLIVLSLLLRALYAAKVSLEAAWRDRALRRRYVVAAQPSVESDAQGLVTATLTAKGVSEQVKIVEAREAPGGGRFLPWRFGTDVPRAALVTVMVGVGYLLMLAVMTMNVGYFLSVLGGAFLGELFFGRFANGVDEHAH